MAQGVPRTSLHASRLIRVLAELTGADVADSRQSLGERVGQWLDFKDAIALYSVLHEGAPGQRHAAARAASPAGLALHDEFIRARAALVDSINADDLPEPRKTPSRLQLAARDAWRDGVADFAPLQRHYLGRQRDMGASISPLRAKARAVLAQQSASLRQLAVLDGVLDQGLGGRERTLLATLPQLLARHFARLHQAHVSALAGAQAADDPDVCLQPGGWLAEFCRDMQAVLRAELDLRLQPVAGLIEALGNEVTTQQ